MEVCGENPDMGVWEIKSVHVPKNQKGITLYMDTEYEGKSVTYENDEACIEKHDFETNGEKDGEATLNI